MKTSPIPNQARTLMPYLVLAAGLAITALVTFYSTHAEKTKSRLHFDSAVEKTSQSIEACIRHHITLLRAGNLFFSANRWADPAAQLKAYASEVELRQAYPGVQALELSLHFTTEEKRKLDQDRSPAKLKIWPDSLRPDYFPIVAAEPADERNRAALGYDLFTEPTRRAAMLQACDTAAPLASGKVILEQEIGRHKQAGFLIFMPLYQSGRVPPTVMQRRQELRGFVCCAFRIGDLITKAVEPKALLPIGMEIYDSQDTTPLHLLFTSVDPERTDPPRFQTVKSMTIAGRPWKIVFSSRPEFESASVRDYIALIPILGLLFTILLFAYLRAADQARTRAETQSTELAKSESLLKESAQRNRILVEHAPVVIWEVNAAGACTFVNQTGLDFTALPRESLLGNHWRSLFPVDDMKQFLEVAGPAMRERKGFSIKSRIARADGQLRWVLIEAIPLLRDDDKRFRGYIGTCVDVTEQENAHEWLRLSEEFYRVIAETAADGVLTMDRSGIVLSANEIVRHMFGWTPPEIVGKSIETLIPDLFENKQPSIRDFFSTPQVNTSCKDILLTGKHQNGTDVFVELSLGFGKKQGVPFVIGILRDVSQRRKIQSAMAHIQKMQAIGSLAGGIAHDFNNVFTAILSHLDLAMYLDESKEQEREHLEYVKTSASRGAELVKRLLAFSRQSLPQTRNLNPGEVVKETVALLQRSITRRIQINFEQEPGIRTVRGDDNQLKQVVINLCLNARDAMPEGGCMSISVTNLSIGPGPQVLPRKTGEFVRITVSDTGPGISKQVLDRLFEPYFTTKEFGNGAGLGLSIANNIVTEHGGWIEVESVGGEGSRFHVILPQADASAEATAVVASAPAKPKSSLEGTESILIADDDYMIRNLMRAVLAYRGYKVSEATDGKEAVDKASSDSETFDLLLLDLEMPNVDGWAALTEIHSKKPKMPIILCTGMSSSPQFELEAINAGATRVLSKPFTNPELLRMVRDVLNMPTGGTKSAG